MEPVETMKPPSLFNEDLGLMTDGVIARNIQHEATMASDMERVATDPHKNTSFNLSSLFGTDSSEELDPQCWAEKSIYNI